MKIIRNTIISCILFLSLIFVMIFSINYLNKTLNEFINLGEKIEEYITENSWDKAYKESISLIDKWDFYSSKLSIFVDHKDINIINIELWKLSQYTKVKTKDESLASIHTFKFYLKHIMEMEKLNIANIF